MRRAILVVIIALLATDVIAQTDAGDPEAPAKKEPRERLGVRIGYATTDNGIQKSFGSGGLDIALHWIQKLGNGGFGLNFALGQMVFGSTERDDIVFYFPPPDEVSFRIVYMTITPIYEIGLGKRLSFYVGAGLGLYINTFTIRAGFREGNDSSNRFGVNGQAGVLWRLGERFFIELNAVAHKYPTKGTELDNPYPAYAEGDKNPIFIAGHVGFMLLLF